MNECEWSTKLLPFGSQRELCQGQRLGIRTKSKALNTQEVCAGSRPWVLYPCHTALGEHTAFLKWLPAPPSSDGCSAGKPSNLCSPLSSLQMAWDLNVVWPLQLGDRSRLRKCGWEAAGDAGSAPCVSAYFLTSERRISSAARPPQTGPTGGHSSVWGGPHLSDPAQPGIFKLELPIKPGRKSSPGYWISLGYVQGPGVVPHIEIEKNLYMGCRKTSLRKAPPEMAQPCKCFEWTENLQHEYFTGKFWQAQHLSSSVSLRSWLPLPPHCAGCPLDPVNAAMALSRSVAGLAGPWHFSLQHTLWHKEVPRKRLVNLCLWQQHPCRTARILWHSFPSALESPFSAFYSLVISQRAFLSRQDKSSSHQQDFKGITKEPPGAANPERVDVSVPWQALTLIVQTDLSQSFVRPVVLQCFKGAWRM